MKTFWRVARFFWPVWALALSYAAWLVLNSWYLSGAPTWIWSLYLPVFCAFGTFLVWSVVKVFIGLGIVRRRLGWYTTAEKNRISTQQAFSAAWYRAINLRAMLAAGGNPQPLSTWDVMLGAGETLLLDVPMNYARYYGTDTTYRQSSVFAVGRPAFVIGSAIGNAIGNAAARNAAIAAASPMWREHQVTRTLVTNHRIMCRTGASGWLSFYFSGVSACYPDPAGASIVFEFGQSEPLRLHGIDGPMLCVLAIGSLYGRDSLNDHPALSPLRALTA
jgi:hypothetical protein